MVFLESFLTHDIFLLMKIHIDNSSKTMLAFVFFVFKLIINKDELYEFGSQVQKLVHWMRMCNHIYTFNSLKILTMWNFNTTSILVLTSSMASEPIPHTDILNAYLIQYIKDLRSQSQKLTHKNEGVQPHIYIRHPISFNYVSLQYNLNKTSTIKGHMINLKIKYF